MPDRFPQNCWDKNCPYFKTWDISIDDIRCCCELTGKQCDASDQNLFSIPCPLSDSIKDSFEGPVYIDINKVNLENLRLSCTGCVIKSDIIEWLHKQPSVSLEHVVKCGECKYYENAYCTHPENISHSYDGDDNCYDHYIMVSTEHFCSYGELKRKENKYMTVAEFIEKLSKYNPDAKVTVCVKGTPKEFELCYGGSEGCTPASCDSVDLLVDTVCEQC